MKKVMVFMITAAMAFSFVGTAMAQDTVDLNNVIADPNLRVFWPLVYSDMDNAATDALRTGASAYLVSNDPYLGTWYPTGTTVFAISNERTNAAGTEMRAVQLTDLANNQLTGTTPIGPPQLLSGTTTEMILYAISSVPVAGTAATGGATIYKIDGGSGAVMSVGVPFTGFTPGASGGGILTTGNTYWSVAPPTLEWNEATSAASIFGVSGTSLHSTGVSVWRRSSATLAAPGATGTTVFNQASGVSAVYASPVISGNSLFVVAYHVAGGNAGISVFQFDKQDLSVGGNNIYGAAINSANVIEPGGLVWNPNIGQKTPTPAAQSEGASGGTLYVTDWSGGVTLYDTQNLARLFNYGFVKSTAGVTASPAVSSRRLVLPFASSVSVFSTDPGDEEVRGASGVSLLWQHDFDENLGVANNRYQILSTPAISNGYVWVTVIDTATAGTPSTIWRFDLNDDFDGEGEIVTTELLMYADPIIVGDYDRNDDNENGFLWYSSFAGTVDRMDQSRFAEAEEYWTQYKFDAAKTAENTLADPDDDDDFFDDDDSGCFLSTIQ